MIAVLIACLISAPSECRKVELPLASALPVMQWKEAQERAVDYLKDHPDMRMMGLSVVRGREV